MLILSYAKWILAEIIRINCALNIEETNDLVDSVIERSVKGAWEDTDITRILVEGLTIKEQIFFLLYSTNHKLDDKLLEIIEYKSDIF